MERYLSLIICMLITHSVFAYDLKFNGVYYNLDHVNKTATVTYGSTSYNSYSGTVDVPDYISTDKGEDYDVVAIGDNAFRNSSGMTNVTIATGIETIGANAFYGCSGLTSVKLPTSVTTLGSACFRGCSKVTDVTLSSRITAIPSECFCDCSKLKNITLPKNVTTIGDAAFQNCLVLANVSFSTVLANIGNSAFRGCSILSSVTLPSSVKELGSNAFYDCVKLSSINLNEGLTKMGDYTLANCSSLTEISLPSTLREIGSYLFSGDVLLANATMNCQVTKLPDYTFNGCSALSIVTLPSCLITIGSYAFKGSSKLPSLTIPATLTKVESTAFNGCGNLKQLVFIEGMVTVPRTYAYAVTQVSLPESAEAISDYAFYECENLVTLSLPKNLKTIGVKAFRLCSSIPSLVLPASLTSIGTDAFADCSNLIDIEYAEGTTTALRTYATKLTKVTVPSTCHTFADNIFEGCTALSRVYINHLEMWNHLFLHRNTNPFPADHYLYLKGQLLTELNADFGAPVANYAFANTKGLKKVILTGSITDIQSYAFANSTDLQNIVIGNGVKTIGSSAFLGCNSLENVRIGKSVTEIKDNAFYACTTLKSVRMGGSEKIIGDAAFKGCTCLPEIILPATVTSIGVSAFEDCKELCSINLPEGLAVINNNTFSGCLLLSEIAFPSSVVTIGGKAFYNCPALELIDLPDAVESIGADAFNQCKGINFVTIGTGIKTIESGAFSNCTMLKAFYCRALAVPTTNSNSFSGSDPASITLYVPDESTAAYKAKIPWSSFAISLGLSAAPVYANEITLSPEVFIVSDNPDDEDYIRATVTPNNATNAKVTWTSSNTSVATVSRTGLVTPVMEGVATITCTASDKHGARAKALVIVANKFQPVTSISLDKTELTLTEGDFYQLIPTTLPTTATHDVITWTSSDNNVARVSEAGIVTAMNAGNVDIMATTSDGTRLSAVCRLTVEVPTNSILSTVKDANGDGIINADDITTIKNHILGRDTSRGNDCDVNGDGNVTISDINAVIATMKGEGNIVSGPLKFLGFNASSYNMIVGDIRTIAPVLIPYRAVNHVDWSITDTNIASVQFNQSGGCTITALAAGQLKLTATANDGTGLADTVTIDIEPNYFGMSDGHKWADLGLPSGTLWATNNLGATSQEDHGNYIAWGELAEKQKYDWSTYSLCNGSSTTLTKYCIASSSGTRDDKTVLDASDDAAASMWSANWSMPTNEQLSELFNTQYTTTEWTTVSGVYGQKVTSKLNGCSIFLPAAGYMSGSSVSSAGSGGYYASKNLSTTSTKAYGLNFGSSTISTDNESYRCYGLTVRPVLSVQGMETVYLCLAAGENLSLVDRLPENVSDGSNFKWGSSNVNVLFVTSDGVANALSEGTVIVYGIDAAGFTVTFKINVTPLILTIENPTLKVSSTTKIVVNTNLPVTWNSNNTSVATVDSDGKIMAHTVGKFTITCQLENGASKSVDVYVCERMPLAITNTADAKINLNYVFKTNTRIEVKLTFVTNHGGSVLGEYDTSNDNDDLRFFMREGITYFDLGNSRISYSLPDYGIPYVYDIGNYYIKRDGTQLASSSAKSFTRSQSLWLFPAEDCASIYYIKIYEDDKLVREYIPAYMDGLCFFERQEGKFYKAQNPQFINAVYDMSGKENGYDYIDLGLLSGLKWATCNVGATKSEEYGDYYAWGETETKSDYNWSTYKWCNGTSSNITKYNSLDNKASLDLEDDIAHVKWGGNWRMPTEKDMSELRGYCTWEWSSQGGIKGYIVTGPNGNSIFMPAAGFRCDSSLSLVGSIGTYWTSSLDENDLNGFISADVLQFNSNYTTEFYHYRNYGRSIRLVCP